MTPDRTEAGRDAGVAGRIEPPHTRTYDRGSRAEDHDGAVAEVHLSFDAVAQVSATLDNAGFMIRVWPAGGTHEYGGNNLTLLTAVVTFDAQLRPTIETFEWREPTR